MYTVMFNAMESVMDIITEIFARIFYGGEEIYEKTPSFTFAPKDTGWKHGVKHNRLYLRYDSPYLSFQPEIPIVDKVRATAHHMLIDGSYAPAPPPVKRMYLESHEVASDKLFEQIKGYIEYLEKMMGERGGKGGNS